MEENKEHQDWKEGESKESIEEKQECRFENGTLVIPAHIIKPVLEDCEVYKLKQSTRQATIRECIEDIKNISDETGYETDVEFQAAENMIDHIIQALKDKLN